MVKPVNDEAANNQQAPSPSPDNQGMNLLLELFSGRMLASVSIDHDDTIAALKKVDAMLDPDSSSPSLARFVKSLGARLTELESESVKHFSDHLREMSRNEMQPTRKAVQTIIHTFEEAQTNRKTRDPQKRKEIAEALKKVPAGIDFIISELDNFSRDFKAMETQFASEREYLVAMKGHSLPDDHVDSQDFLKEKMADIHKAFYALETPIIFFHSEHLRIKNRANMLEKEFMTPPKEERSVSVS